MKKHNAILFAIALTTLFFLLLSTRSYSNTPVLSGEAVGYIDSTGRLVIDHDFYPEYYRDTLISDGRHFPNFTLVENAYFHEGKATVEIPKHFLFIRYAYEYALIDDSGKVITETDNRNVSSFSEGIAKYMRRDRKFGYLEYEEYVYIDSNFKELFSISAENAGLFRDGLAFALIDNKYGFLDKQGHFALQPKYDNVTSFSNGLAGVQIDGKWGFMDKLGNIIIEPQFEFVESFSEGISKVLHKSMYAFIDIYGQFITAERFESAGSFSNGLARVMQNKKYGFIDRSGKLVIDFTYLNAYDFTEGLAPVRIGNKWGFINTKNEVIIKPEYDLALNFKHGIAKAWRGTQLHYINRRGEIIWTYTD